MEGNNGQSAGVQSLGSGYNDRSEQTLASDTAEYERLVQEFRTFVSDCEALLREARTLSGHGVSVARTELARRMDYARQSFGDWGNRAGQRAGELRASTEDYVRREPFKAIGIAAAAGAFLALVVVRRS